MNIVELEDVTRIYRQGETEVRAIDGVSIAFERGEFTAVVGPSGSGKTTMLNMIGALDLPTRGRIAVEGTRLEKLGRTELSHLRRDRIGFVFQAYNLIPVL